MYKFITQLLNKNLILLEMSNNYNKNSKIQIILMRIHIQYQFYRRKVKIINQLYYNTNNFSCGTKKKWLQKYVPSELYKKRCNNHIIKTINKLLLNLKLNYNLYLKKGILRKDQKMEYHICYKLMELTNLKMIICIYKEAFQRDVNFENMQI